MFSSNPSESFTAKKSAPLFVAVALGLGLFVAPSIAQAQNYDGYCYQKNSNARTKGTVIGAVAGAAVGSGVAAKGAKTEGGILGAIVGGAIGNKIAKDQKETARANCLNSRYYVYDRGYYEPDSPPDGYRTVYFTERPNYNSYYVRHNGRDERWDGRHRHGNDRDRY
ncbi:glycine zipper 2TM domain-containing protein [Asticcacaulis machinosus]|uniref:17 kDa surface antigen n=1 Tax=Asticcacaulis machinosus TaxID=2984211 RepID=A0ABT5HF22_9CAUL|nr:glycine zipper 2TM domain-containing protein [Asticcacaulis machinosus]MDC7674855.1 glycine zipper 2TM domain-containing protein [Asticcacaulis machinosus]